MSLLYSESVSAAKPPVAIRITRPYQSEDELLANELDTISRTGVVLVGAQQRPEGVILRFELALASGTPVLRGEGRVVGYKAGVVGGEPGLAVRFTRLDSKSKSLVDRVTAMREMRRSSLPPPPIAAPPAPPPPVSSSEIEVPVSVASSDVLPPVSAREPAAPTDRDAVLGRLRERAKQLAQARVEDILATGAERRRRA